MREAGSRAGSLCKEVCVAFGINKRYDRDLYDKHLHPSLANGAAYGL